MSRSFSRLFLTAGLLVDLDALRLGRVRLSLLDDELSDDELLERELLPELELLEDFEPLDELDSDELRLLSLLLEPDSDFFFLSLLRSFFLSLSSSVGVFLAMFVWLNSRVIVFWNHNVQLYIMCAKLKRESQTNLF